MKGVKKRSGGGGGSSSTETVNPSLPLQLSDGEVAGNFDSTPRTGGDDPVTEAVVGDRGEYDGSEAEEEEGDKGYDDGFGNLEIDDDEVAEADRPKLAEGFYEIEAVRRKRIRKVSLSPVTVNGIFSIRSRIWTFSVNGFIFLKNAAGVNR